MKTDLVKKHDQSIIKPIPRSIWLAFGFIILIVIAVVFLGILLVINKQIGKIGEDNSNTPSSSVFEPDISKWSRYSANQDGYEVSFYYPPDWQIKGSGRVATTDRTAPEASPLSIASSLSSGMEITVHVYKDKPDGWHADLDDYDTLINGKAAYYWIGDESDLLKKGAPATINYLDNGNYIWIAGWFRNKQKDVFKKVLPVLAESLQIQSIPNSNTCAACQN